MKTWVKRTAIGFGALWALGTILQIVDPDDTSAAKTETTVTRETTTTAAETTTTTTAAPATTTAATTTTKAKTTTTTKAPKGPNVQWEDYAPTVRTRIDDLRTTEDCAALQAEFDQANRNNDLMMDRTGHTNGNLMEYILWSMEQADCYG